MYVSLPPQASRLKKVELVIVLPSHVVIGKNNGKALPCIPQGKNASEGFCLRATISRKQLSLIVSAADHSHCQAPGRQNSSNVPELTSEVEILKKISHPHVVTCRESFKGKLKDLLLLFFTFKTFTEMVLWILVSTLQLCCLAPNFVHKLFAADQILAVALIRGETINQQS